MLDFVLDDNRRIAELHDIAYMTEEWQVEAWEAELGIIPGEDETIGDRINDILTQINVIPNGDTGDIQDNLEPQLRYRPQIITSPPPFWLRQKGGFTALSGHYLVSDSHKNSIWVVLDHTKTAKPCNVTPLLAAIAWILPANIQHVGFWFDDYGSFDYNNFPPWPDGGDPNITTS